MKTLSTGALFTDVLAAAAREGYPGTVTHEGINYKTIKVGTTYQFRQISYPAPAYETYEVSTADATATVIAEWDVAEAEQVTVEVLVQGHKSNYADGLSSFVVAGALRAAGGNVEITGSPAPVTLEDSSGAPAVTVAADTTNQRIQIKVAGIAAEEWHWQARAMVTRSQT